MTSLAAGVTALGLMFSGSVVCAQPTITGVSLPNSPNAQNGFNVGSVQFQGAVAPSINQLVFQVGSGTGVTSLTLQLTSSTLPGSTSSILLTPSFGLSVSGDPTSESVSADLSADAVYTAVISATDSSGTASTTLKFDTINPDYFTFEAEDFDYNGGQFFDSLPPGTFPSLDAYSGLAATVGIDCNNHTGGLDSYRPNPLETEDAGDTPRVQYESTGYPDFDIGFNNGGDWGNYTRNYPAGVYNIYLRGSGGNGPSADACTIGMVTSGWGTSSQTTNFLGDFSVAGLGWQTYTWCPAQDANGNLVAWGAGGDQETLRFTVAHGNCNENCYLLVPAAPQISPNSTNIYQGNPATLSFYPYSLNTPTIQWQTDNGTGGATWTSLSGENSTTYAVPSASLPVGPRQYQVLLTVLSNSTTVTVTSAPVALNILAPTKPIIAGDTYPASATAIVGSETTFTASFVGSLPITYQWLVSSNLGQSFTAIPGATNTTLEVLDVSVFTNEYELEAFNSVGSNHSTAAILVTTPAPPPPPLQLAGDLVAELRSSDLTNGQTAWINRSGSAASVGNFQEINQGALSISNNTLNPGTPLWGAFAVNALYVNSLQTAIQSAQKAPAEICGNGASSGEAWIYSTSLNGNNTVIGYGLQGQSAAPEEDREMNWGHNSGCFSGDFGNLDCGWPSPYPTTGTWEYLAWTYDGTNAIGYVNGAQVVVHTLGYSTSFQGYPIETADTVVGVGAALDDGANIQVDNFGGGWIASVRLSSGVLTPAQISNNFAAGLLAVAPVTVYPPTISPTNVVTVGTAVTLTGVASNAQFTFTYQWLTDSGTDGATWTAISGATNGTYTIDTTGLAPGTYEYELAYTNVANGIGALSSPITITVTAATAPMLVQDVTPNSITMYVTDTNTLSASFSGEAPLTYQWQVSSDGTHWTDTGVSTTNIIVTSEVPLTNYYRLTVSNPLGTNVTSTAEVMILPALALPPYLPLQTAGDLIVNLQEVDLSSASDTWSNVTSNPKSVGDFSGTLIGGTHLDVSIGAPYLYHRVPTLFIGEQLTNAVQSALLAPSEILTNNPVSAEAWIFATAVNEQNSCAMAYGIQGGSADPEADREFNYCNQGSGAVSGDFGNYDTAWGTTPAPGAWHYLAWTYDGTTVTCYLDGQPNAQNSPNPLNTPATVVCVGGGIANDGPNLSADAFQGYIGAARLMSGVLTADQIQNNYTAGLLGRVGAVVWAPSVSPVSVSNIVYKGDNVTLGLVDRESTTFTYQWITDNGSQGATWSAAPGSANGTNYALNTSTLAPGTYEFAVVLNNSTYSLTYTSAPVTITILAASAPVVQEQTTPASTNVFVGQSVTFTASYAGNSPITYQWQFSTNGTTFAAIPGATNTSLTLTNAQLSNAGSYRLTASNSIGAGTPTTAATLTVSQPGNVNYTYSAGLLTLTWPAGGTLLQATNLLGPWTVVQTTSPYELAPVSGAAATFFKVSYGQ